MTNWVMPNNPPEKWAPINTAIPIIIIAWKANVKESCNNDPHKIAERLIGDNDLPQKKAERVSISKEVRE